MNGRTFQLDNLKHNAFADTLSGVLRRKNRLYVVRRPVEFYAISAKNWPIIIDIVHERRKRYVDDCRLIVIDSVTSVNSPRFSRRSHVRTESR